MRFILFNLLLISSLFLAGQKYDSTKTNLTEKSTSQFKDKEDGAVDISDFLGTKTGFLPVPSLITNPATGYGGALGIVFFHSSFAESKGYPSITAIIGAGTQNKTWATGIFHMQSFWKKKIRYSGSLLYSNFNSRFYGFGYTDYFQKNEVMLNLRGWFMTQKAVMKISESNFYSGFKYVLFNGNSSFSPVPKIIERFTNKNFTISELQLITTFDSRNNFFSPSKGFLAQAAVRYSDSWLGASKDYIGLNSYGIGFVQINKKHQIGLKAAYNRVGKDAPFFSQPFVDNRGVAIMRYQDEQMFEAELEAQINFYKRWSLVGFLGTGDAFGTNSTFYEDDFSISGGTGFRYLLARKFGMKAGLDFAWDEQFAFQITVGSAWLRN